MNVARIALIITLAGCARVESSPAPPVADAESDAESEVASDDYPLCDDDLPPLGCPTTSAPCTGDPLIPQLEAELAEKSATPTALIKGRLLATTPTGITVGELYVAGTRGQLAVSGWTDLPPDSGEVRDVITSQAGSEATTRLLVCTTSECAIYEAPLRGGPARRAATVPPDVAARGLVDVVVADGVWAQCVYGSGVYCIDGTSGRWLVPSSKVPLGLRAGDSPFVAGPGGVVLRLRRGVCRVRVPPSLDLVSLRGDDYAYTGISADQHLVVGANVCALQVNALDYGSYGYTVVRTLEGALVSIGRSGNRCTVLSSSADVRAFGIVFGGIVPNVVAITKAGVLGTGHYGLD